MLRKKYDSFRFVSGYERTHHLLDKDVRWRCQKMYGGASKIVWLNYFLSVAEMLLDINFPFSLCPLVIFRHQLLHPLVLRLLWFHFFPSFRFFLLACWRWRISLHLHKVRLFRRFHFEDGLFVFILRDKTSLQMFQQKQTLALFPSPHLHRSFVIRRVFCWKQRLPSAIWLLFKLPLESRSLFRYLQRVAFWKHLLEICLSSLISTSASSSPRCQWIKFSDNFLEILNWSTFGMERSQSFDGQRAEMIQCRQTFSQIIISSIMLSSREIASQCSWNKSV